MLPDILILASLILLNGFLSMSELAVVSARRPLLQAKAEAGGKGARTALLLAEEPGRFLSSIQIGITLIGILSGAYGGATLAEPVAGVFTHIPALAPYADDIGLTLVVTLVTYFSLVIGELVPKQLALRHSIGIACSVAPVMVWLALITRPVVAVLDLSNRLTLRLMGVKPETEQHVTEEEVKAVIAEGGKTGVLDHEEQRILQRVMKLDDISVASAMTNRQDIVWIDVDEPLESVLEKVARHRHTRYPVCEKTVDNMLGTVVVKDLLLQKCEGKLDLASVLKQPLHLPDTTTVLEALEHFRKISSNMAVIVDEYGSLEGIVTLKDIMEAMVGILPEPTARGDYTVLRLDDGSWLVDGMLSVHLAQEALGLKHLADEDESYNTMAGFLIHRLRHLPREGESVEFEGHKFEIIDMDGHRIDKVRVRKLD